MKIFLPIQKKAKLHLQSLYDVEYFLNKLCCLKNSLSLKKNLKSVSKNIKN